MKPTTKLLVREAKERREAKYSRATRNIMAELHRSNRNTGKYGQLRDYSRARANYLWSVGY